MSLYHTRVGIIKGWLIAKDAPQTILNIAEQLAEAAAPPLETAKDIPPPARKIIDWKTNGDHPEIIIPPADVAGLDAELPVKKKYKKLTPEAKRSIITRYPARNGFPEGESTKALSIEFEASQSTIIGILHKAKVALRPSASMINKAKSVARKTKISVEPAPGVRIKVVEAPSKDIDQERVIQDKSGYIGNRADRTLVHTDWGDIQKMRYNGLPDARIAKSYGVEEDYLLRFIGSMEKRDEGRAKNL